MTVGAQDDGGWVTGAGAMSKNVPGTLGVRVGARGRLGALAGGPH